MQKSLAEKSQELKVFVEQTMKSLWFFDMIKNDEKIEIVGSIKYGLALEWESDVDIWISTNEPRSSFLEKMNFIIAKMTENKFLKKININNLFDEYPIFDKKKEKLIKPWENSNFFMIEAFYYLDDSLEKKINFQIHIWKDEFRETFPELLQLNMNEKETLLELKSFVYKEMPFFWNRSFLLYQWFLQWFRTKESMKQYLIDNWYEKLLKK